MTGWHTLYKPINLPIHFRMNALRYKGHTTLHFTKSSRWAGITTFPISAKSYSWILLKHRKRSKPSSNPISCETNASRSTPRYFRVPSYFSDPQIMTQEKDRSQSTIPAQVLNLSCIHRELSNLFINRYIPGPHVSFSVHISRWRINPLCCYHAVRESASPNPKMHQKRKTIEIEMYCGSKYNKTAGT